MASRRPQTGAPPSGAGGMSGGTGRSNEYFVPRDGIDREVITADICRYLGNDALVRPGHYENPQTGQVTQGYYITAYRNLTTAMIDDLKADSARWEAERRQQAARNAPSGYRDSATHNARQYHGPTDSAPGGYPDGRDPYEATRYPGSLAPGYSGNSGGYQQPQSSTQYPASGGYYPPQSAPAFPSESRDPRFTGSQPAAFTAEPPYAAAGTNLRMQYDYGSGNGPQASRGVPTSGAPPPASAYAQQAQGFGGPGGYYPASNTNPGYGAPPPVQSQDPLYGRASPAGASQFNPAQQQSQYDAPPNSRSSVPSPSTQQMASSATAHSSRTRERESADRHPSDRHPSDRHRPHPRR